MLLIWPVLLYSFTAAILSTQGADFQALIFPSSVAGIDQADLCMRVSPPCMSEADRYSLEALQSIHQMMDDDKDGGIEVEESMEFIIEDMKQQQTNKHSHLHKEDQHITIEELWRGWKSSEVHNWTQDVVLRWLREFVELPQYEKNFKEFKVNGNTLPRIAANEPSFLSFHLRIQDQRDKQKLNIKALDAVLFGPPTRPPHNYMKDLLLIVSVVMGVGGCWFAQAQNKASKVHIAKMMKDLESLQRAEQSLIDLQEQLERAQEEKRNVAEEKQNLEEKIRDEIIGAQEEASRLHELRQGAVSELSRLRYAEEELEQVLGALKQAEQDMHATWIASEALQQWLQLTHEVEVQYYNVKKQSAVLQLACAKEEAERIKKKRSSVLGTLHVAHSSSLDQVDHKILEAKNALSEITTCLRERLHRWQQIEQLCGFPIIRNPGLAHLTAQLYSDSGTHSLPRVPQSSCACQSSIHGSIENLLEATTSAILPQMPVPPLKRSLRKRQSTVCRSRRPGAISQPAAAISSDPDLLIPIRSPYPCFSEEEEGRFLKILKKQDSEERFSDPEYLTSTPINKLFPCPSDDISFQNLHHEEVECLSKETETVVESPVHRISVHELNTSADFSCRTVKDKLLDASFEASLKKFKEESYIEATPRKISRDRNEAHMNIAFKNTFTSELDTDHRVKLDRDVIEDTESRKVYRERSEFPLDARKMIWNEKETTTDVVTVNVSADVMGISIDSGTRKGLRDDAEHPFEPVSRRSHGDSVGVSFGTIYRKHPRNKGEFQLESSGRALTKDKMAEIIKNPLRKTSREELDYYVDTVSTRLLPREKFEADLDTTSDMDKEILALELPLSKRLLGEDHEIPASSLRKRVPRMPKDDSDSPTDQEKADLQLEAPKTILLRDNSGALESRSAQTAQPDLMITSQGPRKPSTDLLPSGSLSQLVYDGILEKSYNKVAPSNLSASTANLQQLRLDPETQLLPAVTTCVELQGQKDKERSRKSMKLKNLFKKKNDSTSEKVQSSV